MPIRLNRTTLLDILSTPLQAPIGLYRWIRRTTELKHLQRELKYTRADLQHALETADLMEKRWRKCAKNAYLNKEHHRQAQPKRFEFGEEWIPNTGDKLYRVELKMSKLEMEFMHPSQARIGLAERLSQLVYVAVMNHREKPASKSSN